MKKCLLFLVSCLFFISGQTQTVSYSFTENNPYRYNYHFNLRLFDVDYANKQSLYLGYSLQGNVAFRKLFSAEFLWSHRYGPGMDFNYHFAAETVYQTVTTNKPTGYQAFELGGMFHVKDRVVTRNRKVVLSSSGGRRSGTTVTKYIRVPAEVRSITAIRGGLYHNAFAITDQDHGSLQNGIPGVGDGGVIASDGTRFGAAVNDYQSIFYNTKAVTNMNINGVYLGLAKAEYYNVSIDPSGYGEKSSRTYFRLYADVILAAPIIQDFKGIDGKTYKVQGGGAQGFETRPLGARIGYDIVRFGKA
ncbi:MAG TPA: hypothetical protein PLP34_01085, partial [Chitinophagaceae bacterium]|nr:hypothetical protein [Chitinophagaceae bacterium]